MNKRSFLLTLFIIFNIFIFEFLTVNSPSFFGYYVTPDQAVFLEDEETFRGEKITVTKNGNGLLYVLKVKDEIRLYLFRIKGKTSFKRYAVISSQTQIINYDKVTTEIPDFDKWDVFTPTFFNRNGEGPVHFCVVKKSDDIEIDGYNYQEFKHNNKSYYFVYYVERTI